ncbi:MAG: YIEGIA domain-containing protein [Limnochordia bacterium]
MEYLATIIIGTVMGTIGRVLFLDVDYRQYPSYPQAYIVHLALGFIAAFLGSVAVPAVLATEFTAATFLALAATQFREVRNIERETLERLEQTELVKRGTAYIEGIAKVFEARNYLAMGVALVASIGVELGRWLATPLVGYLLGIGLGFLVIIGLKRAMLGQSIGDIAHVRPGKLEFDGPLLTVEGVATMNVGQEEAREQFRQHGVAIVVEPKDIDAKAILANVGQRQAMVHDAVSLCGTRQDVGEREFMPLARRDLVSGKVVITMIPGDPNVEALILAVKQTPVLEAIMRRPSQAKPARVIR